MTMADSPENVEDDGWLHANGIDALTGMPAVPPITPGDAIRLDPSTPPDPAATSRFAKVRDAVANKMRALPEDLESKANDPASVGWAVVFSSQVPPEVRAAVEPLIAHRRNHTQVPEDRLKVLEIAPEDTLDAWLRKLGAQRSDVDPTKLPYYVLFVGSPASIPFEHQSQLAFAYAVGRLCFDRPEDYQRYVASVIEYETAAALPHGREVAFWGTRNRADRATQLSADCLVKPLVEGDPSAGTAYMRQPISQARSFRSRCHLGAAATRANLLECLHGAIPSARPAFLFTASHGLSWPKGNAFQEARQGALLCQDWPGMGTPPEPAHCLTAVDVGDDARVHGLIAFLFACYGAGTPATDHFLADRSKAPVLIADSPFVAALPQRLLAHPGGGALAVIGHVERAWGYSIRPIGLGNRLQPFRNLLGRVLRGDPVGLAIKDFSERYAAASMRLLNILAGTNPSLKPCDSETANLWVECNDARNYILLGDPAVRLRIDAMT